MNDLAAVKVIGEKWTCRCCSAAFKSEAAFEAHLRVK
jgi:Zinc-finger of C2H2 type